MWKPEAIDAGAPPTRPYQPGYYVSAFNCVVCNIEYDFFKGEALIHVPPPEQFLPPTRNWPDLTGSIEFFRNIDPNPENLKRVFVREGTIDRGYWYKVRASDELATIHKWTWQEEYFPEAT